MKNIRRLIVAVIAAAALWVAPLAAQAQVATLDNMTCGSAYTDITPPDEFDPETRSTSNYQVFWFYTTVGDECVMELSFDENPLMVFVSGGKMTQDSNWERDTDANTAEVTFTARQIQQVDSEVEVNYGEGETLTTVAFIWEGSDGQGPDDNVDGAWVATDFQEYTLINSSTRLGAEVRGDDGDAGKFAMYMPASAVSSMAEEHEDYGNAEAFDIEEDMAVYLGDSEQNEDVTETDGGGAFLSFSAEVDSSVAEGSDDDSGGDGQEDFVDCDGDGVEDEDAEESDDGGDPCAQSSLGLSMTSGAGLDVRVAVGPRDIIAKPKKPKKTRFDIIEKTAKRATLKWKRVSEVETYTLQIRKCTLDSRAECVGAEAFQGKAKYRTIDSLTGKQKEVKKLKADTFYQWRLKACNSGGCSKYSDWYTFKTK